MNKCDLFFEMLLDAKKQDFGYIGTGNPEAKLLILGKEVAINTLDELSMNEYENNLNYWERDKDKSIWDIPTRTRNEYSPLCPFKGQYLKKSNGAYNWGTSTTWMNYQKLHNYIFGDSYGRVNFHKNFFISEVNGSPSLKTYNADRSSIGTRKLFFKNSEYFQSFSVVILAGTGYFTISENQNEIEEVFGVKFIEKSLAGGNKKQPYWLHWNKDKTKLVINTYQLSINISDALLKEIAIHITRLVRRSHVKRLGSAIQNRWYNDRSTNNDPFDQGENFESSEVYRDNMAWM